MRTTNNTNSSKGNITYSKVKGWGICAKYSDGTLTTCSYGKTKQEAKKKLMQSVNEYYK